MAIIEPLKMPLALPISNSLALRWTFGDSGLIWTNFGPLRSWTNTSNYTNSVLVISSPILTSLAGPSQCKIEFHHDI
jgi:hypothetical protein